MSGEGQEHILPDVARSIRARMEGKKGRSQTDLVGIGLESPDRMMPDGFVVYTVNLGYG